MHAISSKTGLGIDELQEYFKPRKTIVFLGSSGVGKSSLVNRMAGFALMKVNDKKTRALQGKEFGRSMKKFKKEMQKSGKFRR